MIPTILLIGGHNAKNALYAATLDKHYNLLIASSGKQGLELAKTHHPLAVILDAASMGTPGERVCRTLDVALGKTPIIHIHPGPRDTAQSAADVVLFLPLSARRLQSNLKWLISAEQDEIIGCGPFRMNVTRRIFMAGGKETQLTPKQALLLEVFLRNPGKTIDRKMLMEKVWETDYLGDTRTLDVHIRWIRQVMENGDKKSSYLKTIRGVGYCLEIPQVDKNPL